MITEGDFYGKTLVLAIIGLFLVTSMIPVSSLSIDKESCESITQPIEDLSFNSTFPYLRDDVDISERLSEKEIFKQNKYEEHPHYYDGCLRNRSEYPFDEDMEKQGFWEPKLSLDIKVPDINTNHIPVIVTLKNHRFLPIPVGEMDLMQLCDYGRTLDFEIVTPDQHTIYFMGGHWRKDDYRVWLIPFGKKYYLCDLTKKCFGEKEEECYSFLDNPGTYTIKAIYNSDGLAFAPNLILPHMVNTWDGHLESETKTFELEKSFIPTFDGNTLYVGGTGPNNYTRIQDAINAASNGDTIYIYSGTYQENLLVDKKINLLGEDWNTTFIDGHFRGEAVSVVSDWVNISGFTISNSSGSPYLQVPGINLNNVQNCRIRRNNIVHNWYDININSSSYCVIIENIINNNWDGGIRMCDSSNIDICDNIFGDRDRGIIIDDSSNLKILDNVFHQDGITIRGTNLSHWNTHIIEGNMKDEAPIYYYQNTADSVVPSDAGQVLLANCSNMLIQHLNLSNVQLGFSSHNTISDNNITNITNVGIYLYVSSENDIQGNIVNTIMRNGIEIKKSLYNTIFGNSITNNNNGIILSDSSKHNIISANNITNSDEGIWLHDSSKNTITGNNIDRNNEGIWLYDSSKNTVQSNNISNTGLAAISVRDSSYSIITENIISESDNGITLYDSSYIKIDRNMLHLGGITINGRNIQHWNTHTIEQNFVDEKLIRYYRDAIDGVVPSDAGQVILANCSNMLIQHLNLSNAYCPLQLGFSSHNTISNNSINNNAYGIILFHSSNNTIFENYITGSDIGIQVDYSESNMIGKNTILDTGFGIFIYFSKNNSIQGNNFLNNMVHAQFLNRAWRHHNFRINIWRNNYWDDWIGIGPKIITGGIYPRSKVTDHWWLNFDWYPAKEPFDVGESV